MDTPGGYDFNEPPPEPNYAQPTHPPQDGPQDIEYVQVSCTVCGYNLTGAMVGGLCPECGSKVDTSLHAASAGSNNGMAVASMVLGIISLPSMCCCVIGLPTAITGLVLGIVALNQIKTGSYAKGSHGMALAGIWCSAISMVLTALWVMLNLIGSF